MLNLEKLFNTIKPQLIPIGYPAEGFLKMEHGAKVVGASARDVLTKRRVSTKTFFNQSTIVIRKLREDVGGEFKEVNVKLFANGGFQMTGVTSEEFARTTLEWMIAQMPSGIGTGPKPVSATVDTNAIVGTETVEAEEEAEAEAKTEAEAEETPLTLQKFAIQLLNSDYRVNALIKRADLHKVLCDEYRLSSTLETTIYQGVNAKYYYNEAVEATNPPGICHCPRFCNGQGDGSAVGACKKITIAAFQTGSIIITGARNRRQLDEAYGFINRVLQEHEGRVTKPLPVA